MLEEALAIELARKVVEDQRPGAKLDDSYASPVGNTPLWDVVFMQNKINYYHVRVDISGYSNDSRPANRSAS